MNVLLVLSAIIGTVGIWPYIQAIRRGESKPQFVTWTVWTILATITAIASLRGGNMASAVLGLEGMVACGSVAIMGLRYGSLIIGKIDVVSIIGAVLGLISLAIFRQPMVALLVTITIDVVAYVPTFIHGWKMPNEETIVSYVCGGVASGLSLVAAIMSGATISGLLYPLYSVLASSLMVSLVVIARADWRQYWDAIFATELEESTETA